LHCSRLGRLRGTPGLEPAPLSDLARSTGDAGLSLRIGFCVVACSSYIFYKREDMENRMDISSLEQSILLAIVALHPNAYGVSIRRHIARITGHENSIGSTYAALGRLERKGYIESRPGEPTAERGGRRKLYVTITADGQTALQESLKAISLLQRGLRWRAAFRHIEAFA
jgi:DNA-binding PadR family transcriptional regulator